MRLMFVIAAVAFLSACASQAPAPAPAKDTPAAMKAPQCWNGDVSAFQNVGTKTTLSGVAVECKPTSDGKSAQWTSAKH